MRTVHILILLAVFGQTYAKKADTGPLLMRGGLYYKPFQTEPFTGLHREWRANGQLHEEVAFKEGKADGLAKGWYENGQLRIELTYKDGKYC